MPERNPHRDQAREIVLNTLSQTLVLDRGAIGPRNTLCSGLGMESIDPFDLVFKLECATGIKGLDPFGQKIRLQIDPQTHKYTIESMKMIRDQMSHFYNAIPAQDRAKFDEQRSPKQFQNAWNVEGLVSYVETQLRTIAS